MFRFAFAGVGAVSLSMMLPGCGGGSSPSGGTPSGAVHSALLGEGTVTYFGETVPAQTFTQNGLSLVAMAGANFTNVTLHPTQNIQNSLITYVRGNQIWVACNGTTTEITHVLGVAREPSPSKNGQIAFYAAVDASFDPQIFTCNFDGSALKQITSGALNPKTPSWSPSGSKIVFSGTGGEMYTVNANGSGLTDLQTVGFDPAWSPDGTRIAFEATNSDALGQIYTMPAAGGVAVSISDSFSTAYCSAPAWSPDGTQIMYVVGSNSGGGNIFVTDSASGSIGSNVTLSGGVDQYPTFGPDGTSIAFVRSGGGSRVLTANLALNSPTTEIAAATDGKSNCNHTRWSSYFGTKTFIGPSGLLANAAGFVWCQLKGFSSFMAFSATTPSTATITGKDSNSSSGTNVFLIKADHVTKINYTNSYYGSVQTLSFSAPQVLVSFDSATGVISTIAPLAVSRTAATTPMRQNGHLVYAGPFPAVYSRGKNVAPSGASRIEIDEKTGRLVSWR